MDSPTTIENKALAITKAITNKGFNGMPSVSHTSSFVSGDSGVVPISSAQLNVRSDKQDLQFRFEQS